MHKKYVLRVYSCLFQFNMRQIIFDYILSCWKIRKALSFRLILMEKKTLEIHKLLLRQR